MDIKTIEDLKEDTILVIFIEDKISRRKFHEYVENKYPNLSKMSIHVNGIVSNCRFIVSKCYHCNKKIVYRDEDWHNIVFSESDIGGEYTKECSRCEEVNRYEPRYDDSDDLVFVRDNNAILIGHNLGFTNKFKNSDVSKEDFDKIFNESKKITFKKPLHITGKKEYEKIVHNLV